MMGGLKAWFTALSTAAKIGVVSTVVAGGGIATSSVPQNTPTQVNTITHVKSAVCSSHATTTIETENVPFDKTTIEDPKTEQGHTYLKTQGVDGVKTITYEVTTHTPFGCQQNTKTLIKEDITIQPVTEVTAIGIHVAQAQPNCPNGTYTNTYGNIVCRPYASPESPNGATAQCRDGTYSFSQSRRGTCSYHGGVAQWL